MTYPSEGVPFGSVAAYRPGRPRSDDTAMTSQGRELVRDLKFARMQGCFGAEESTIPPGGDA